MSDLESRRALRSLLNSINQLDDDQLGRLFDSAAFERCKRSNTYLAELKKHPPALMDVPTDSLVLTKVGSDSWVAAPRGILAQEAQIQMTSAEWDEWRELAARILSEDARRRFACKRCDGRGEVQELDDGIMPMLDTFRCPDCKGTGESPQ